MTQPYLAQVEIFSFNFAPKGWAQCNGQLLPINQNQALFSLLGTTYGGDGRVNFGLPDLRSRVPMHFGSGGGDSYVLGERGGEEIVTINSTTMAAHTHNLIANNATGNTDTPATTAALGIGTNTGTANPGGTFNIDMYSTATTLAATLASASVTNTGGSQGHSNLMPYLVLNMCIALQGIFPSQN
jgi:microcystin-dependent protein